MTRQRRQHDRVHILRREDGKSQVCRQRAEVAVGSARGAAAVYQLRRYQRALQIRRQLQRHVKRANVADARRINIRQIARHQSDIIIAAGCLAQRRVPVCRKRSRQQHRVDVKRAGSDGDVLRAEDLRAVFAAVDSRRGAHRRRACAFVFVVGDECHRHRPRRADPEADQCHAVRDDNAGVAAFGADVQRAQAAGSEDGVTVGAHDSACYRRRDVQAHKVRLFNNARAHGKSRARARIVARENRKRKHARHRRRIRHNFVRVIERKRRMARADGISVRRAAADGAQCRHCSAFVESQGLRFGEGAKAQARTRK